jgi:hypothetical protein
LVNCSQTKPNKNIKNQSLSQMPPQNESLRSSVCEPSGSKQIADFYLAKKSDAWFFKSNVSMAWSVIVSCIGLKTGQNIKSAKKSGAWALIYSLKSFQV